MRRFLPAILIAACSSDPPAAPAPDAGPDAAPEVSADAPAPDAAPDAAADAPLEAAIDAVAVVDAASGSDVSSDAAPASEDAVAVAETGADAEVMDSPTRDADPTVCGGREVACSTSVDCAMCAPSLGLRWCCGVIAGRRSCAVPSGGWCPGLAYDASVPDDARYNCANDGAPRCQTHNDCAVCLPSASGSVWCCRSDFCRPTMDTSCR